jgi:hypothetical protein
MILFNTTKPDRLDTLFFHRQGNMHVNKKLLVFFGTKTFRKKDVVEIDTKIGSIEN